MNTCQLLLRGIAGVLFVGYSAVAAPITNTLWFSGDPVSPPDYGNQATTTPQALTTWQEFIVTTSTGWNITDVYSIGQDLAGTHTGEWSIRTGMGIGVGGTTIAGGTGSLIESGYAGRTVLDINIATLHLGPGNYWLEVAPQNGSISVTNGTNSVGTTPTDPASSLRNWPLFNQSYINAGVGTYSEGVAGLASPEPASWVFLAIGLVSLAFLKFRPAPAI